MTIQTPDSNFETFTLRPATAADFPAIKALIRTAGINPLGLAWERFIIAVGQEGKLIGCGQIKPHRDGSLELASIAVVLPWRKKGVASAIIQHLMAGYDILYLTCRQGLVPFYQRFGFRTIQPPEMHPYFRRISRMARLFASMDLMPGIAVMKRNSGNG